MDIQTFATIAQGVSAIFAVLLIIIKPFRYWFLGVKERKNAENLAEAAEKESVKCLLRSEILSFYFRNRGTRQMHQYEFENISLLVKAYKNMGGNAFVDKIWEEIQTWEIVS